MNRTYRLLLVPTILLATTLFTGCASFLEFDDGRDVASVDRGYQEEEQCDTEDCTPHRVVSAEGVVDPEQVRIKDALAARDVVLGMSRDQVLRSWGAPAVREVAGRRNDGHERWHYGTQYSLQGERIVIFENGRVAGWYR
jgi:hypothetical protein